MLWQSWLSGHQFKNFWRTFLEQMSESIQFKSRFLAFHREVEHFSSSIQSKVTALQSWSRLENKWPSSCGGNCTVNRGPTSSLAQSILLFSPTTGVRQSPVASVSTEGPGPDPGPWPRALGFCSRKFKGWCRESLLIAVGLKLAPAPCLNFCVLWGPFFSKP